MKINRLSIFGALGIAMIGAGCGSTAKDAAPGATTPLTTTTDRRPGATTTSTTTPTESNGDQACRTLDEAIRSAARKYALTQEQNWKNSFILYESDVEAAADTMAPAEALDSNPTSTADRSANSETNVQEKGIDEGDTAEHDGRYLFTVVRGELRIIDTTTGTVTAHITQASGNEQLILKDNRLLVTSEVSDIGGRHGGPGTAITIYDVTNKTTPKMVSQQSFAGEFGALRAIGTDVRLVLRAHVNSLQLVYPAEDNEVAFRSAHETNERMIQQLRAESVIPGLSLETAARMRCEDVVVPTSATFDGLTSIVDLNLANGESHNSILMANPMGTYQSAKHLYTWSDVWTGTQYETSLHVFDTERSHTKFVQTIEVHGHLLNQFAVSEYEGALRIATTIRGEDTSAIVTYLSSDGAFREVSKLTGLGHQHEMIYAVRFAGPKAYVVTFVNTDPLYVVDLSDPKHPKLNGELLIPGYSNYLQVVSKDRVIGVGQNLDESAVSQGARTGAGQVSLFDVSDPQHPKRLDTMAIGDGSESESDHHALLWWAKTQTLVIPFAPAATNSTADTQLLPRNPVMVIAIEGDKLVRRGRVTHQSVNSDEQSFDQNVESMFNIRRSMVIDNQLVTVSAQAVKSTDLVSLYPNWYLTN
jgi:hypothetical protein